MVNNIPAVFCFDKRIVLGAAVAIKSLIDSAKDTTNYDIRIFHSDLSLENQKNLTALTANTRHNLAFHYIDPSIFDGAPRSRGSWTEIVYYRLLVPEILKEYDRAIYADVDVLFKGDLAEVYNMDLEGREMAAVPVEINNEKTMICHKYFPENKNDKIYISSFLVMNNKLMREEKTVEKFFNTIKTVGNRLKFYDLDVLNITIDRFAPISFKYGVFQSIMFNKKLENAHEYSFIKGVFSDEEILEAKNNPVMVHYAGKPGKPWRMKNPYPDYKEYMDNLPSGLRHFTFRDIRKRFFSRI